MQYFWLLDSKVQKIFQFHYQPGQENLGDYPSKHHSADIHQHVRPYYVQMNNSPTILPRAARPSSWQGCVETLGDPYRSKTPLPSVPNYQEPDLSHHLIWNMKKPDAEKITRRRKSQTLKKSSTPLHSTSQSGVEQKYEFIQCMNSHV